MKFDFEQLSPEEATSVGGFLANVVGRAHARQMDAGVRKRWKAELRRHSAKSLEAPSWLWASVVNLVASHEAGYLEHCRKYAMETAHRP